MLEERGAGVGGRVEWRMKRMIWKRGGRGKVLSGEE